MEIVCPCCGSNRFDLADLETIDNNNCIHYCICNKCHTSFAVEYQPISITEMDGD